MPILGQSCYFYVLINNVVYNGKIKKSPIGVFYHFFNQVTSPKSTPRKIKKIKYSASKSIDIVFNS